MTSRNCPTGIESDDSALLQYESLRSQALNRQEAFFRAKSGSGTVYTPRDACLDRSSATDTYQQTQLGKSERRYPSLRMKQHRK